MKKIPLDPSRGRQTFITTLGSTRYRFRFRYRLRSESWYMDMEKLDGTPLLQGARVGVMTKTIGQYRAHDGFPNGEIILIDLQAKNDHYTRDEVVSERRLFVFYTPDEEDEIEALAAQMSKESGGGGITT